MLFEDPPLEKSTDLLGEFESPENEGFTLLNPSYWR
jgi:hypothetical protein